MPPKLYRRTSQQVGWGAWLLFHKKLCAQHPLMATLPNPQTRLMCRLTRACLCLLTLLFLFLLTSRSYTYCGKGRHTGICGPDGKEQVHHPGKGERQFSPSGHAQGESQTGMVAHACNPGTVWRLRQEDGCETSLGYRVRPGLTNEQTNKTGST